MYYLGVSDLVREVTTASIHQDDVSGVETCDSEFRV
jgi:hypothetical protein